MSRDKEIPLVYAKKTMKDAINEMNKKLIELSYNIRALQWVTVIIN